MATRIQRAWRAYVRHKNECATRIQRFWRQNKYNIGYLQLRDYGHQLLGGRKERRRFSLISQRMFLGDYLNIKNGSGLSTMIRNAINLKPTEEVMFSMKGAVLVPRAMRSSIPSPRTFVLTNSSLHIVMATKNGKSIQMVDEKVLSLNTIRSASLSTLRDDWVVLHLDGSPDGDCILSCIFKTELVARLSQLTNGRITVNVTPEIQYKKKGGKTVTMKFVKDESVKNDDLYKSHVVRVGSGEPATSRKFITFNRQCPNGIPFFLESRPPASRKSKTGNVTPRANTAARRAPAAIPQANNPQQPQFNPQPQAINPQSQAAPQFNARPQAIPQFNPQPQAAAQPQFNARPQAVPQFNPQPQAATPSQFNARPQPKPRATPPAAAPPPPPKKPAHPLYKAIYPFESQEGGEISFVKGDTMEILEKDENGKCQTS